MARAYSLGTIAKLDKLENFVMLSGQVSSNSSQALAYVGGGTLYILAAIGVTSGSKVRDTTAGVDIYTMTNANTIYSAPSSSPLASYNYPAGNSVVTVNSSNSIALGAMAGFMDAVPKGFLLQGVGGYLSVTNVPGTININPTTTRPYSIWGYSLSISLATSPADNGANINMRIYSGTVIETLFANGGVKHRNLKTGPTPIVTVSSGQNLVIEAYTNSSSISANLRVAGVILYKT
jgi:hypothetical protein